MNKTFTWRLLTPGELTDVYLQEMRRDFPAGELKPLSMILTSEAEGLAHTWGVFDGETLAAYLLMVRPDGSVISQLDYFAVVPAYRAGGLGAKLLAALPEYEAGAQAIIIEAECPKRLRTRPWPCAAWAFTPDAVPATPATMSTCLTRGSASWCCPAPRAGAERQGRAGRPGELLQAHHQREPVAQICAVLRPGREPAPVRETLAQGCKGETAIAEKEVFLMTTKMTRRTFLKGAAAAAAAVSLSGLLTGCGDQELPDNEIQIGAYTVKVYDLDVDQGTEMNKAGAILGKVKLRFADGGGNWQTMRYDGMFSATVNGCNLTQVAPTGRFTVTDSMGGKLHSTVEQELRLSFPNEGWRYQYQNGAMAVLTIKINGMTGTLYLVKRGNVYVATKIKPMN